MKNACVVLRKNLLIPSTGEALVLRTLSSFGEPFESLSAIETDNAAALRERLKAWETSEGDLFLVAEEDLSSAQKALDELFVGEKMQQNADGAGIYEKDGRFVVLLSASESGDEYAKKVCLPVLQRKRGKRFERLVVRAMGVSEVRAIALVREAEIRAKKAVRCTRTRAYDEEIFEIFYDETVSKMLLDDVLRFFVEGLGDCVYALEDCSLEEQIVRLLKLRGKKLSVAESFTGGGIARRITSVSGASEVYFEGLNVYNERAKTLRLGVSEYTLRTFGAVSDQCAYEMAAGLLATGNCDFAVATTGLAGPNSDRSGLPVGLSFIAVGTRERIFVYRYKFDGSRTDVTEKAIRYALFLAHKQLKKME